ncbi:hypothetical protein CJ030_MR6G010450 [Morella rubra]|uniref:Uncharacterized protein n=1 Tax=Morella rubra TaxID=262757 RepID=A0A6A1V8J7_9ROSI|nr:hypothetical protein CJ030_MR6G010450 [Morella rubra]
MVGQISTSSHPLVGFGNSDASLWPLSGSPPLGLGLPRATVEAGGSDAHGGANPNPPPAMVSTVLSVVEWCPGSVESGWNYGSVDPQINKTVARKSEPLIQDRCFNPLKLALKGAYVAPMHIPDYPWFLKAAFS